MGYYGSYSLSIVVVTVLIIVVLLGWVMAISLLIRSAHAKGYEETLPLVVIGLFASPIVLGLVVIAMPDGKKLD